MKLDNPDKLGMLAWYNLFAFYNQETDEHKTNCLEYAMTIKHWTHINELGAVLDRWLLACAKTHKMGNALTEMQKFVYLKRMVPKEIKDKIEDNKYKDREGEMMRDVS